MTIRCPNKECNTKMNIVTAVLYNPTANAKCPSCNNFFKPYDLLPESEKQSIKNKQMEQEEATDFNANSHKSKTEHTKLNKEAVGWLVVHDEKTHTQTYDLLVGRQVVGRKSTSRPCEIMIDTEDMEMSRNHFIIEVESHQGKYKYSLSDSKSTNKTYVQTKVLSDFERAVRKLGKNEEIYIEDGSIIQAGTTKIILKTLKSVNNKSQATEIVTNQHITKTIVL